MLTVICPPDPALQCYNAANLRASIGPFVFGHRKRPIPLPEISRRVSAIRCGVAGVGERRSALKQSTSPRLELISFPAAPHDDQVNTASPPLQTVPAFNQLTRFSQNDAPGEPAKLASGLSAVVRTVSKAADMKAANHLGKVCTGRCCGAIG